MSTLRVDTIELSDDGPDRVRISGVKGEPPPPTLKVSLNSIGGFRNEMALVLTGLDIEAKAELVRRQLETSLTVKPAEMEWTLARTDHAGRRYRGSGQRAAALRGARSRPANVGRQFSSAAVELALASYPGFTSTAPPGDGQVYGVFTPGYVTATEVPHVAVHADGTRVGHRSRPTETLELAAVGPFALPEPLPFGRRGAAARHDRGARSGDKGGSANVGVWVRTEDHWRWLAHTLTVEKLRELLPETADLPVTRHVLPNLWAVNFVIEGILGQGVAYQARFDPQAKGLGEWLRSRHRRRHPGGVAIVCEHLEHPEREQLRKTVRAFAEREVLPNVDEWERIGDLPRELHRKAGEAGLLGAGLPEAVGGGGGDGADAVIICEEMHYAGSPGGVFASLFTCGIAVPHMIASGDQRLIDTYVRPTLRRRADRQPGHHRTGRRLRRRAPDHTRGS